MADGPFQTWSAVDRIAWLADEMGDVAAAEATADPMVVAAWAAEMAEAAEEITAEVEKPASYRACGADGHTRQAPCDRPQGHREAHSWEAAQARARLREYETLATVDLPQARHELLLSRRRVEALTAEVAEWEAKPRWRSKPKVDRG